MRLVFILLILSLASFSKLVTRLFHATPVATVNQINQPDSLMIARKVLYLLHPAESDVDNVYRFLLKGFAESKKQGNHSKEYDYSYLLARACIVKDQAVKAPNYILPLINDFHQAGNNRLEAKAYLDFAMVYSGYVEDEISIGPFQDDMGPKMLKYFNHGLLLARQANDKDLQYEAIRQIAFYWFDSSNAITGNHHGADSVANVFLNFCQKNKPDRMYLPYTILMQTSKNNYAFPEALNYGLQAVANAKLYHHEAQLVPVYYSLAELYYRAERFQEALDAYENLIATARRYHKPVSANIAPAYTLLLFKFNMGDKAIQFLRTYNPDTLQSLYLKYNYYLSFANLYYKLAKYQDAEKYYLLTHIQVKDQDTLIKLKSDLDLGDLYVAWKKYEKARSYVELSVDPTIKGVPIKNLSIAQLLLFKIDSAAHNYPAAVQHLILHNDYQSKYVDQQNHKAVDEIEVKYKTAEKEKDIELLQAGIKLSQEKVALADQNVKLSAEKIKLAQVTLLKDQKKVAFLNVQNQLQLSENEKKKKDIALKNQKIKLLTQSNDFQQLSLSKANFERKMTLGGIFLLAVILVLLIYQFRIKQKNSNEINQKNVLLQQLVNDKELLIKEVHHRVKNNLHTITSLLETQSSYLGDSVALEAISESQSRIKAIALIHHRLYSESNLAVIEMQPYLLDLVQYLKDTYNTGALGISFTMDVDALTLDVQQAIPIGLMLNETVTNAIKYAFSDGRIGRISIELKSLHNSDMVFKVKDNGIGLPPDLEVKKSASMGMALISGLAKQLSGMLDIVSTEGTTIKVVFNRIQINQETEALLSSSRKKLSDEHR